MGTMGIADVAVIAALVVALFCAAMLFYAAYNWLFPRANERAAQKRLGPIRYQYRRAMQEGRWDRALYLLTANAMVMCQHFDIQELLERYLDAVRGGRTEQADWLLGLIRHQERMDAAEAAGRRRKWLTRH